MSKIIDELKKDLLYKEAGMHSPAALPAALTVPAILAGLAGTAYSNMNDPADNDIEAYQAELVADELRSVILERAKKKKLNVLEDSIDDSARSIRI